MLIGYPEITCRAPECFTEITMGQTFCETCDQSVDAARSKIAPQTIESPDVPSENLKRARTDYGGRRRNIALDARVVELSHDQSKSRSQIAEELGLSYAALASRIRRLRSEGHQITDKRGRTKIQRRETATSRIESAQETPRGANSSALPNSESAINE